MFWGNCDDFDFSMCERALWDNRWMKQGPTSTLTQGTAALQKVNRAQRLNPCLEARLLAPDSELGVSSPKAAACPHLCCEHVFRQVTDVYRWRDGTEISDVSTSRVPATQARFIYTAA